MAHVSMKRFDDRVLPLWRMDVPELPPSENRKSCLMQNQTLDIFICGQIDNCKYECTQKEAQRHNPGFVKRQLTKINEKIRL